MSFNIMGAVRPILPVASVPGAGSHVDVFIKFDGVDGESQDSVHKGAIELMSLTWGTSNSSSSAHGTGSGKGKFVLQDFNMTARTSKASPVLAKLCASGRHLASATIFIRKAGGTQKDYLTYTFKEVFITGYTFSISESHVVPVDLITFSATDTVMEYKPQDSKGGLGGGIKFGVNKKTTEIY